MHHRTLARVLAFAVVAAGCSSSNDSTDAKNVPALTQNPNLKMLVHEWTSGMHEPAAYVVNDNTAYMDTWARIYPDATTRPVMPPVDFTTQMLLVAAMGQQPTTGFDIAFDTVTYGTEVQVGITERIPVNCLVLSTETQPVIVAQVSASSGTVTFHDNAVDYVCP
jgi:PrcB C-terminal